MLLGHALILSLGVAWLAYLLGWQKAITVGLTPFLLGSVLKSALAAAIVNILHHGRHDTAS
jgi:biotin transport system substrate-specific component